MSGSSIKVAGLMVGMAVLLTTAITPPAQARVATAGGTAVTCTMDVGSVTASGDHTYRRVTAGTPPTMAVVPNRVAKGVYAPGQVRLSSTFVNEPDVAATFHISGWVVQGSALYRSSYSLAGGVLGDPPVLTRIGGGWTDFKLVEEAEYAQVENAGVLRNYEYGLRTDGLLVRWQNINGVWRRNAGGAGFESVKTMALISKTATYDTFLANTRGGALYTIRISTSVPATFDVRRVRTTTWHVFETLMAVKCGVYGTLLLGIDKGTKSGYLYAVGHANGLSTVIKGLGKVQGAFPDPIDFRWRNEFDPLNGD
ncbi:hypothetical protein [Kribbella shirazensis]|uniref:Uncharacterized protein n=1 Tax=Kribbella shirazensis TaxID=1105143 RepID=A0A7X5V687_9ACTN|nr:hypothetical protein [Kribbella shirazensis]NIK55408.1 hypothetical protein [Kribbella shirazensis]